ncbi:MAG: ABC transporter ATP-binding protein, partial [Armatimonadetes bacterium]|nr:ABC transporter ATP-binding protein [Anaerolineae bacterium]
MQAQAPHPVADLQWLGRYALKHPQAALGALVCGMIGGFTASLEPYLIGGVIDRLRQPILIEAYLSGVSAVSPALPKLLAARNQSTLTDELTVQIAMILGLALVTIVAFFGQRHYSGKIAYAVNFDIRHDLFDNLLTLEHRFYQEHATGDLISRMHSDLTILWQLLALGFTRMGSAFATLIVVFVLLSSVNFPLTLVAFTVLAVSTSVQMRVGLKIAPLFEQVQDQAGAMAGLVQDTVSGIQTIKTAGREPGVYDKFRDEAVEYRRRWLYFKRRYEPVGLLPNMISETTAAIVVLVGGVLTLNGSLTLGDFTSYLIYLT